MSFYLWTDVAAEYFKQNMHSLDIHILEILL